MTIIKYKLYINQKRYFGESTFSGANSFSSFWCVMTTPTECWTSRLEIPRCPWSLQWTLIYKMDIDYKIHVQNTMTLLSIQTSLPMMHHKPTKSTLYRIFPIAGLLICCRCIQLALTHSHYTLLPLKVWLSDLIVASACFFFLTLTLPYGFGFVSLNKLCIHILLRLLFWHCGFPPCLFSIYVQDGQIPTLQDLFKHVIHYFY